MNKPHPPFRLQQCESRHQWCIAAACETRSSTLSPDSRQTLFRSTCFEQVIIVQCKCMNVQQIAYLWAELHFIGSLQMLFASQQRWLGFLRSLPSYLEKLYELTDSLWLEVRIGFIHKQADWKQVTQLQGYHLKHCSSFYTFELFQSWATCRLYSSITPGTKGSMTTHKQAVSTPHATSSWIQEVITIESGTTRLG